MGIEFIPIVLLSFIVQIFIIILSSVISEYKIKIVKKPKDSTPSDYIMD